MSNRAAALVGCHWFDDHCELGFVARSIAGAASRSGPLAILVPGDPTTTADGAFDLQSLGPAGALRWPEGLGPDTTLIVDDLTPDVSALLTETGLPSVHYLSGTAGPSVQAWQRLPLVGGDDAVGVHVPVNRLAERHRHHGFGFTDYLLVLSDRIGVHAEPPPEAAWVSAGFSDADVVVVEDAVAWAWKGRALRGKVTVDTRMDLWRLLAHANVCIDLVPGPHIARECIEALRFGTPIIVPDGPGPGAVHARASGGGTFHDSAELLDAVARLADTAVRAAAATTARRYADERYGDPAAPVRRLRAVLGERNPVQ